MKTRIHCMLALLLFAGLTTVAQADDWAFITTTDFTTGSASVVSTGKTANNDVAGIFSDATARYFGGLVYVVNRLGADNVQVINPAGWSTMGQHSAGNGTNPHDIVVLGPNKAYVTRYDATSLLVMNPTSGAHTGSISFTPLNDSDGLPEMDTMVLASDRVFVTVQRLDRNAFYTPSGTSYLAVIDTGTDSFVDVDPGSAGTQHIALSKPNPFSEIQLDPNTGNLYVSCVNFFGLLDGGVEWIDPMALTSLGTFFTESAAGGDILDVEIVAPDKGFAVISTPSFFTELISFNPATGVKTGTLYAPGDYVIQDIDVSPTGELFLCDRTPTAPGIRCYDTSTSSEITTSPINVGLPPFDITFNVDTPSGVPTREASPASLGQNYPNPFNPSTTIPYTLEAAGHITLAVFDVRGHLVRTLVDEPRPEGSGTVTWDGRDLRGATVRSGIYFARMEFSGEVVSRKLLLVK